MKTLFSFAILFVMVPASVPAASDGGESLPSADVVVARTLARNAQRQKELAGYRGMRQYVLQNDRLHRQAEMVVQVEGAPDDTKHFKIVRELGWKEALNHVLHKMLESEERASTPEMRINTRLSPDNYAFSMVRTALADDRMAYVIDVIPRRHDEDLFEGRVWIDAQDYAVTRIEGKPAKNPSSWTRSVQFTHVYQKSGSFWFPLSTESLTEAHIFGATRLTINYFNYTPNAMQSPETASATLPRDPIQ